MSIEEKGWALITGASSGIGAAFANLLAEKQINLLLCGRRTDRLQSQAESLHRDFGVDNKLICGDLADPESLNRIINTASELKNLRYIICNAGYGADNSFFSDSYTTQKKMLDVHVEAHTRICHALAPLIAPPSRRADCGIIIVSSLAAFFSTSSSVFYCATKAFLNSFASSLACALYPRKIPVQALCPGFTRTDFHDKLHIPSVQLRNKGIVRWMSPEKVARISLKKLKPGRIIVIPGFFNKLLVLGGKLTPSALYIRVAAARGKLFSPDSKKKLAE